MAKDEQQTVFKRSKPPIHRKTEAITKGNIATIKTYSNLIKGMFNYIQNNLNNIT